MEEIKKYAQDYNIQSYLCYKDIENLKSYVDMKDFEQQVGYDNMYTLEDYISTKIYQYNFELAMQNEDIEYMLDLIYGCEFDIEINEKGKLDMVDLQGAYLGGIESYENFEEIASVIDRLSGSYLYDYYGIE